MSECFKRYPDEDCVDWPDAYDHKLICEKLNDYTEVTTTKSIQCKHKTGWYEEIPFWVFRKKVFVCTDCERIVDKRGINVKSKRILNNNHRRHSRKSC